jgi:3-deoxy-D-manno-octulosonate 8-phosphate phosphatase (KDO 8-P phosphatase)
MIKLFTHSSPPKVLILDVDGVLTDRRFVYGIDGKSHKLFGADDHDALNFIARYLKIVIITADKNGFDISKRRIELDFGLKLELVASTERKEWISSRFNLNDVIYVGDGFYDFRVFNIVRYGIAPRDALKHTRRCADYVTLLPAGKGAVAEACIHLAKKFFGFKISQL